MAQALSEAYSELEKELGEEDGMLEEELVVEVVEELVVSPSQLRAFPEGQIREPLGCMEAETCAAPWRKHVKCPVI